MFPIIPLESIRRGTSDGAALRLSNGRVKPWSASRWRCRAILAAGNWAAMVKPLGVDGRIAARRFLPKRIICSIVETAEMLDLAGDEHRIIAGIQTPRPITQNSDR